MTRMAVVVTSWGDDVIDVLHVRPRREPSTITSPLTATVVVERDGRLGCLLPEGARGWLVGHGAYRSLENDRQLVRDAFVPGARLLILPDDASARIEVGALTFEVRPTANEREARRSFGPPVLAAWILASLAFHAPFVVMLALAPPRSTAIGLEHVRVARRVIVRAPEPEAGSSVLGGTGARHALEDGSMGHPDERSERGRYAVPRDASNSPPVLARARVRRSMESVGAIGAVNAMLGAWEAPISPYGADQASGHDDDAALGALMGDRMGGAHGADGLGMRGTGPGGGGTGEGTIALGTLGTLGTGCRSFGCGGGHGGSGYGRGSGGLAPRTSAVPVSHCPSESCVAHIVGSLSRDAIRRVVRQHIGEVRFCYEQGLASNPSVEGRVTAQWIIGADGRVATAGLASSDIHSAAVEQCIVSAVRRWTFPSMTDGSTTGVVYPFILRSSD